MTSLKISSLSRYFFIKSYCSLLKPSIHLKSFQKFAEPTTSNHFYVCQRSLYTLDALGMEDFRKQRAKYRLQHPESEAERFRAAMQDQLARSHHTLMLVFKEDLEKAIYLCRSDENDIALVKDLLFKYNAQNSTLRFGSFRFGAVIMRLLFELERPDIALELMQTPELGKLLSHVSTLQVLMTLLYRHELYSEVLDIMDRISTGRVTNGRYPRICVVIALAAALRQGTEESLARGLSLTEACINVGRWPSRVYAIASTIALQAGRPDTALKFLHNTAYADHIPIKNALLQAWCELGRLDQVLSLLRPLAANVRTGTLVHHPAVYRHTMDAINDAVEQQDDVALKRDMARVEQDLLNNSCIGDQELVDCVLSPLHLSEIFPGKNKWEDFKSTSPSRLRRASVLDESG